MGSYNYHKDEIIEWIKANFRQGQACLDVGACDGKWANLLDGYLTMDAVEIFAPNIEKHSLKDKYRKVFNADIYDLEYGHYDLIIFGDVIEHMTVERAQKCLGYAHERCSNMLIGVPYLYSQGELYGNPYEKHIQNDLTEKVFAERYPGYELLWKKPNNEYAYYIKRSK